MKKINKRIAKRKSPPMGGITDNLLDLAMSTVGNKLATSPEQKAQAITQISDVIKTSIMNNSAMIISGIVLFGIVMAGTNVAITKFSEG